MTAKKKIEKKAKKDYKVEKKRSGRYEVRGANGKNINGEKKVEILVKEGLVKVMKKKAEKVEAEA